jgi:hypothetical protein
LDDRQLGPEVLHLSSAGPALWQDRIDALGREDVANAIAGSHRPNPISEGVSVGAVAHTVTVAPLVSHTSTRKLARGISAADESILQKHPSGKDAHSCSAFPPCEGPNRPHQVEPERHVEDQPEHDRVIEHGT